MQNPPIVRGGLENADLFPMSGSASWCFLIPKIWRSPPFKKCLQHIHGQFMGVLLKARICLSSSSSSSTSQSAWLVLVLLVRLPYSILKQEWRDTWAGSEWDIRWFTLEVRVAEGLIH
jgi:hypothetical protein